jgi:hypothetical protein
VDECPLLGRPSCVGIVRRWPLPASPPALRRRHSPRRGSRCRFPRNRRSIAATGVDAFGAGGIEDREGSQGRALAEEASVSILIDESDELIDRGDFRHRIVAMPLEVAPLPEDAPSVARAHVSGFGHRPFVFGPWRPAPDRADLENLDTLSADAKPEIEFGSDVGWRSALLDELADPHFEPRPLDVIQRH